MQSAVRGLQDACAAAVAERWDRRPHRADLAELYGGSVALDASPLGGLRATLRLPG